MKFLGVPPPRTIDAVRGRLRYELRATWLGGVRVLDRVERSQRDVADRRPALGLRDGPWLAARLLTWSLSTQRARPGT